MAFLIGLAMLPSMVKADHITFENIPIKTGQGSQGPAVIWGNYVVWKGAQNEAYDIALRKIVEMPGLAVAGVPAIWNDKVVWSGSTGYYDMSLQQMVYPEGLSIPEYPVIPAIHDNKVVWSNSKGYYDLNLVLQRKVSSRIHAACADSFL